jgi:hypothetical protein
MDVKVENAVAPVEAPRAAVPAERRPVRPRFLYTGLAVAAIWLASAAASIWTPDMITGSQHEHIPVAAFSFWLYAAIATAFVLMAASVGGQGTRSKRRRGPRCSSRSPRSGASSRRRASSPRRW